jgi:20S proteasome alpha/beta subunit
MSEDEGVQFVINAVQLSMNRDGSSGGFVRIHVINEAGQKTLTIYPEDSNQEVPEVRTLPGFASRKTQRSAVQPAGQL